MTSFQNRTMNQICAGVLLALGVSAVAVAESTTYRWSSETAFFNGMVDNGFLNVYVSHNTSSGQPPMPGPMPIPVEPGMEPPVPGPGLPTDEIYLFVNHSQDMESKWGFYAGQLDRSAFQFSNEGATLKAHICMQYTDGNYRNEPPPPPGEPKPIDGAVSDGSNVNPDDPNTPPMPPPPFPPMPEPVEVCGDINLVWTATRDTMHRDESTGYSKYFDLVTRHHSKSRGNSAVAEGSFMEMPVSSNAPDMGYEMANLFRVSADETYSTTGDAFDRGHKH
ncbi:MAG: hypothetical protein OEZ43_17705 [Gammaproteobacteria bacterium]|nr:hypothetical protein [Gammaproteobacteria bacterium]